MDEHDQPTSTQPQETLCGFCAGTGFLSRAVCRACGGVGSFRVLPPFIHCEICAGTGKLNDSPHEGCNGTGWARVEPKVPLPTSFQEEAETTLLAEPPHTVPASALGRDQETTILCESGAPTLASEAPSAALLAVTCSRCQGRGRNNWGTACPICEEQGSVLVATPPTRCQGCGGDGVIAQKSHPECQGSGWLYLIRERSGLPTVPVACSPCSGTGLTPQNASCPGCFGQGSVLVVPPATKCAGCGGDGIYAERPHKGCQGTGWAHVVRE